MVNFKNLGGEKKLRASSFRVRNKEGDGWMRRSWDNELSCPSIGTRPGTRSDALRREFVVPPRHSQKGHVLRDNRRRDASAGTRPALGHYSMVCRDGVPGRTTARSGMGAKPRVVSAVAGSSTRQGSRQVSGPMGFGCFLDMGAGNGSMQNFFAHGEART